MVVRRKNAPKILRSQLDYQNVLLPLCQREAYLS